MAAGGRELDFTDLAADTSDFALLPDFRAAFMVVAGNDMCRACRNQADNACRAHTRALPASDAFVRINDNETLTVFVNGFGRTDLHAGTKMQTAFLTGIGSGLKKICGIAVLKTAVAELGFCHVLVAAAVDIGRSSSPE